MKLGFNELMQEKAYTLFGKNNRTHRKFITIAY